MSTFEVNPVSFIIATWIMIAGVWKTAELLLKIIQRLKRKGVNVTKDREVCE